MLIVVYMQVFGYSHLKREIGWTSRPGEGGFSPPSPSPPHCLHPSSPPYRHWKHESCNSNLLSSFTIWLLFQLLLSRVLFQSIQVGIWSRRWRQRSMYRHAHKLCYRSHSYTFCLYTVRMSFVRTGTLEIQ